MESQDFLQSLNEAQLRAVEHVDGPLLIVAGAGTGKTTVLINRLLNLVHRHQVDPNQVLILTFTEKAANELAERADRALPLGKTADWIKTFHGLGRSLLARHALDIGLPGDYQLIDDIQAWVLIKKHLEQFQFKYYRTLGNPNKYLADLLKHFSRLKDENISPDSYLEFAAALAAKPAADEAAASELQRVSELAQAYKIYNQLLLDKGLLDYGDLIFWTIKLLKERPNVLAACRQQFRYIMVDEFQDTNRSQYELVRLLAGDTANLAVVGDDDQSIYKFRGASLSNILQFRQDYPQAAAAVLVENYRSGQVILDAAYEFISHNNPNRLEVREGLDKRLVSRSAEPGLVEHWSLPDTFAETMAVVNKIISLQAEGLAEWSDIAVLFRANRTADRFVKELARQGVPYQYLSHRGLYHKPIVLELFSYLKLLDNYHESAALFKVLSMPAFHLDHQDIIELSRAAREQQWSLYEALSQPTALAKLSPEGQLAAAKLLDSLKSHALLAQTVGPAKVLAAIVKDVFYPQLDRDRDWVQFRLLSQVYAKAVKLEESLPDSRLKDFVELVDLEMEAGDSGAMPVITDDVNTVKLATAHSSKGLEFKYVFIVDLVDRRFPSDRQTDTIVPPALLTDDDNVGSNWHLEEERRLFYVAMTRAKQGLYLTSARDAGGKQPKKPSKFIGEIGAVPTVAYDFTETGTELDRAIDRLATPAPKLTPLPLPDKFSFSALENYANCPLQYKFSHILRLPIEKRGASSFGKTLHAVLAEFMEPLLTEPEQADLSLERLLALYDKHWSLRGYNNKQEAEEHYLLGRQYCHNFCAKLTEQGRPQVLGLEAPFEFRLGGQTLYGNIDRIDNLPDGSLRLVDYKTGAALDKPEYGKIKQLLLYKLGAEQKYGRPVSKLAYYFFQTDLWLEFEAKDKDLDKLATEITQAISAIRSYDFQPRPGHHCRYCDFRQICEFRES